jgi:flagellar biosynthesis protein FlhB
LRSLIVILAVGVFIFIAYQFSSGEILNLINYNGPDNVPSTLKIVDTGLFLTYFMVIVAFGAILYNEISTAFK